MGQNVLSQSDCRTFISTISLGQNDEKAWFFAYRYRLMKIKSWIDWSRHHQKRVWPL